MAYGATGSPFMKASGAIQDPFAMKSPLGPGQVFLHSTRNRLNGIGIVVSFLVPWFVYCVTSALFAFHWHWARPLICFIAVALVFVVGVAVPGALAFFQWKRKKTSNPEYTPSWLLFLAVTCLVAFILGMVAGEEVYSAYMQPYYDLEHMAVYNDVEPYRYTGAEMMDVGRINFNKNTKLDIGRSMGFKNTDIYCVAPIVTAGYAHKGMTYDFWAVGKNCCSGSQADFHCPGFNNAGASGAIRLLSATERPFYRLAVQQAEATYKITASHPLFFQWVHDADQEVNHIQKHGTSIFLMGMFCYFVLQAFLTAVATLLFSKMVHA